MESKADSESGNKELSPPGIFWYRLSAGVDDLMNVIPVF